MEQSSEGQYRNVGEKGKLYFLQSETQVLLSTDQNMDVETTMSDTQGDRWRSLTTLVRMNSGAPTMGRRLGAGTSD